jgi:hypothetical protein
MSHIRVLICRVDDSASEQMTELAAPAGLQVLSNRV